MAGHPPHWLTLRHPDGTPRPWSAIEADLAARVASGRRDLDLGGPEPTQSPDLLRATAQARDLGRRVILHTDGRALASADRLDALARAGVAVVCVHLKAPLAGDHDDLAGTGHHAQALRTLALLDAHSLQGRLGTTLAQGDPQAWVDLAASLGLPLHLVGEGHAPTSARAARIDAVWHLAAAQGVALSADGLGWSAPPHSEDLPPPAADANLLALVRAGFLPPSAATGITTAGLPPDQVAHQAPQLVRLGAVPIDVPPCLGGPPDHQAPDDATPGPGCAPCARLDRCAGLAPSRHSAAALRPHDAWKPAIPPGGTVAIVHPWLADQLLVASALPALAAALRQRGVTVQWHSAWDLPFHPHDLRAQPPPTRLQRAWAMAYRTFTGGPDPLHTYTSPNHLLGHPFRSDDDDARCEAVMAAWWDTLDLSGADTVIAPGWHAAARIWNHPSLPSRARLVVADFHMLDGIDAWLHPDQRAQEGAWWPGDRVQVHSCFPHFHALYAARGVPHHAVHWRPYPVCRTHLTPGPSPTDCAHIFSGGAHHRDFGALRALGQRLRGDVHPIHIHADPGRTGAVEAPLELLGMASLPDFIDTIRQSRFVVLPLGHDVSRAAGISVVAIALACGRPVVATRTPAMLDHVRHGVSGWLVEAGDTDALADAVRQIDQDPARLTRLAAGARQAGLTMGVEAWATQLVHGAPPVAFHHAPNARGGTAYAW